MCRESEGVLIVAPFFFSLGLQRYHHKDVSWGSVVSIRDHGDKKVVGISERLSGLEELMVIVWLRK